MAAAPLDAGVHVTVRSEATPSWRAVTDAGAAGVPGSAVVVVVGDPVPLLADGPWPGEVGGAEPTGVPVWVAVGSVVDDVVAGDGLVVDVVVAGSDEVDEVDEVDAAPPLLALGGPGLGGAPQPAATTAQATTRVSPPSIVRRLMNPQTLR